MIDDDFKVGNVRPVLLPDAVVAFERVARRKPLPDRVYHYTTADGLLGIIGSGCIWATNGRYMNDTSELAYGRDIVCGIVSAEAKGSIAHTRTWLSKFADIVEQVHEDHETYIACFCEKGDLLSQWRAYGARRGFALGFSAPHLSRLADTTLMRVEYDGAVQKAAVLETVGIHVQEFETALAARDKDRIPEISGSLSLMLALWVAALKHPSFAEEKEWRVLSLLSAYKTRVRSDRGWLRPYVEISLNTIDATAQRMPLLSVTHGPSPHPELEKRSLRLMLEGTKYWGVEITGSDVPLRV